MSLTFNAIEGKFDITGGGLTPAGSSGDLQTNNGAGGLGSVPQSTFLTSTPTLSQVLTAGNTSTQSETVGGLAVTGTLISVPTASSTGVSAYYSGQVTGVSAYENQIGGPYYESGWNFSYSVFPVFQAPDGLYYQSNSLGGTGSFTDNNVDSLNLYVANIDTTTSGPTPALYIQGYNDEFSVNYYTLTGTPNGTTVDDNTWTQTDPAPIALTYYNADNSGYSSYNYIYRTFGYKTINGVKFFSTAYVDATYTDTTAGYFSQMLFNVTWTDTAGNDGYRTYRGVYDNDSNTWVDNFTTYRETAQGVQFFTDYSASQWTAGGTTAGLFPAPTTGYTNDIPLGGNVQVKGDFTVGTPTSIAAPTGATLNMGYNGYNGYFYTNGTISTFQVYAYKYINGIKVYSESSNISSFDDTPYIGYGYYWFDAYWTPVTGADGYKVYFTGNGGGWWDSATSGGWSSSVENGAPGLNSYDLQNFGHDNATVTPTGVDYNKNTFYGDTTFGDAVHVGTDIYMHAGQYIKSIEGAGILDIFAGGGVRIANLYVTSAINPAGGNAAFGGPISVVGNAQIGYSSGQTAPANALIVSGKVGIGVTSPTSILHLKAGTASANTAPLKFNTGTLLTTAEAGAVEFLTDAYYATTTTNAVRRMIVAGKTGRATGQTAANASVATYTLGATDASYEVSMNVLVTTATINAFTCECAYTDEGNTARVLTLQFSSLAGAFVTSIANAAGAVPYEGVPLHIRCKASTAITLRTQAAGTYTTIVYNVEGIIKQTA